MWTETIAKAEKGNVPYGAIWWASVAMALGSVGVKELGRYLTVKYPAKAAQFAKWLPTMGGAAGAVLVPQTKKLIGDATAKSMAVGLGCIAGEPWLEKLLLAIIHPAPAPIEARRQMGQREIRGHPNLNPNRGPGTDLNGIQGAKDLNATLYS